MTDDLGLPGRRELPPEVLGNVLASVREGMGKPVRRRWPVVAAAAAVSLVLAGALASTAVIRDTDSVATSGSDFTLDLAQAKAGLDRCWAAVQEQGKAASFPDRADWVPLFTKDGSHGTAAVVAAMAGDKPFFCETTETTVTVTDPNATPAYAPGTKTGALLMSSNGTIAGVANPEWQVLDLTGRSDDGPNFASEAKVYRHGNLFVEQNNSRPGRTTYAFGPNTGDRKLGERGAYEAPHILPAAPEPAVSIYDRPYPEPNWATDGGMLMTECLVNSAELLIDAHAYHTRTLLTDGDFRVVVARFGEKVVVCQAEPGFNGETWPRYRLFPDLNTPPPGPARKLKTESLGGPEKTGNEGSVARNPFIGVVPREAAKVSLLFGPGLGVDAPVTDGTFAVWTPPGANLVDPMAPVAIIARDAAGKIIYEGSLPIR